MAKKQKAKATKKRAGSKKMRKSKVAKKATSKKKTRKAKTAKKTIASVKKKVGKSRKAKIAKGPPAGILHKGYASGVPGTDECLRFDWDPRTQDWNLPREGTPVRTGDCQWFLTTKELDAKGKGPPGGILYKCDPTGAPGSDECSRFNWNPGTKQWDWPPGGIPMPCSECIWKF